MSQMKSEIYLIENWKNDKKKIGEKQEFQYLDNIITKMISFVTLTLLKTMSIALELNKYLKPALFFKVALP